MIGIDRRETMFGYVRAYKPELKVKEYELYRASYCGLCRSMGKCTGQCSRMTLSYDFAFLAIFRFALLDEELRFDKKRCIAHPLEKRTFVENNPTLEYCAGAAALLNYHKVIDDLGDEKGRKKLLATLALPTVSGARRKALKSGLYELDGKISELLSKLSELERVAPKSVDEPAGIFGELLGEIMAYGLEGSKKRIAYAVGLAVGRWIYVADALDDWDEDAKRGRYNPFIALYGKDKPTEEDIRGIETALKNHLVEAEGALDLMDINDEGVKNILENILFLGLPRRIEEIGEAKNNDSHKKCDTERKKR